MKESAQAALSYARAHAAELGLDANYFEGRDLHIHVPEGAIPKDGPSAGITIAAAMVSAFLDRPLRRDLAMTGEITLRGNVLPVGGIKEKVLAARRSGITTIILPEANRKNLEEIPKSLRKDIALEFVGDIRDVFRMAFREPLLLSGANSGTKPRAKRPPLQPIH
jgi:ATP-dependent Lon protease